MAKPRAQAPASKKHPTHKVYPYLLIGLKIERANQVWATGIRYIPMACRWVYLCANDSVDCAKAGLARCINVYNTARPHSSLDEKTQYEFCFATLRATNQAA